MPAALCLKAGNAAILRGGSESFAHLVGDHGCLARRAASPPACREAAIQLVPTTDRAAVGEMLRMDGIIDVIVPRGGKSLIERVSAESRVPVFEHLEGICHTYVHAAADPEMARAGRRSTPRCAGPASAARPRRCWSIAPSPAALLPPILDDLIAAGCEIRGDAAARALDPRGQPGDRGRTGTPSISTRSWRCGSSTGFDGGDRAHRAHGSQHTEAIVTEDAAAAERFLRRLDSAIVLVNASTQFADGGEFGMGAEIGIATGKLHARGPVGVEQLTSFKYVVRGTGQCRP